MTSILDITGVHDVTTNLTLEKNLPLILGSSSPRRIELLKNITNDFKIIKPIINEDNILENSFKNNINMNFLDNAFLSCSSIALEKAKNIYETNSNSTIISADTIVVTDNNILGKPTSKTDAYETLVSLLGKFHYVTTAVCIYLNNNNYDLFYVVTGVKFVNKSKFSINYIKEYVDSNEPMDKAGSYGIQQIGSRLINGIYGDYFNVVGFPIVEIRRRLYENFN